MVGFILFVGKLCEYMWAYSLWGVCNINRMTETITVYSHNGEHYECHAKQLE